MTTSFDEWARDFINPKNIFSNREGEIWSAPYFPKLLETILEGNDIEAFIQQKNQDLHDQFIAEKTAPDKKNIADTNMQIAKLQEFSTAVKDINTNLDKFEKDIADLIHHFPAPQQQTCIKDLLLSYNRDDGKFAKDWSYQQLTQQPKGFFNKLLKAKKHKKAQQQLITFIEKYETTNIPNQIKELSDVDNYTKDYLIKIKLEQIIKLNDSTGISKSIQKSYNNTGDQIQNLQKNVKSAEEHLQSYETDFKNSTRIPLEDEIIRSFCTEIRDEIKTPKMLASTNYAEGLDKLPDNEVIMFNIGLRAGRKTEDKTKNILAYNGLKCGNNADQWLVRKEEIDNSDKGSYEIFSPLMTVKEAKEIIPKLMADLDRAHASSGLAVPIKAKDLFMESSIETAQSEITQAGLLKLVGGAWVKQQIKTNNPLFNTQERMKALGIESKEQLPQVFSSLEEIKQQYPKEQFLFSGSTASDDYLALSGRVGRTGIIYATPDISYAAKYDGVTDVGGPVEGTTATGDKYVSSIIGQLSDKDVKVGFINIYEQSDDDKYFPNFGMEDYRKYADSKEQPKTYRVFEYNNEGKDPFTQKQAQTAANGRLTKDQAINGYIRPSTESHEKDGQHYFALSFDAETYVTPDKNPLKAKIMHIEFNGNQFYIPVSEHPDETIQAILNKRQAKMEDTFSHNNRQDILSRMQQQKEKFNQNIISPAREIDFIQNRQARLNDNMSKAEPLQHSPQAVEEKPSDPIGKQISMLRGTDTIPQAKAPVQKSTLDISKVRNYQKIHM